VPDVTRDLAAPEAGGRPPAAAEPVLEIRGLRVSYDAPTGRVQAVAGLDLVLRPGDSVGLVGESGSGKSTVALAVMGLLPAGGRVDAGQVRLLGRDLTTLPEHELRAVRWRQAAMVFQKAMSAFSPVHRLADHFVDVWRAHRPERGRRARSLALERARVLLEAVGLRPDALWAYPHTLSGGMLQRALIALALVHQPRLLILDEATTALDVVTQAQVLSEVARLQREFDLTTLVISHDIGVVAALCRRVAVLYAGHLVEEGPVQQVLEAPRHPYTAALVRAFPRLRGPRRRLESIPGTLPDLTRPPQGCVFADRCPRAAGACREGPPPVEHSGGRMVRCRFPLGGDAGA